MAPQLAGSSWVRRGLSTPQSCQSTAQPQQPRCSSLSTQCVSCPHHNKLFTVHTRALALSHAPARACKNNRIKRDLRKQLGSIRTSPGSRQATRHLVLVELSLRSCTQPQGFRWVSFEGNVLPGHTGLYVQCVRFQKGVWGSLR